MELFKNDCEANDGFSFQINENYAKRYDKWRKNEELQKLKDKYGDDVDEGSSSSDEDEDAVELTKEVEKDFFKTLSCLKEKNPLIYDQNVRFFKQRQNNEDDNKFKKKTSETLTMAAYQRKVLLETNGIIEEEEKTPRVEDLPLVDQERVLKESFKEVLCDSESDNEGVGGLFTKREFSLEEKERNEADYRQWLTGQEALLPEKDEEDLKGLRNYWTNSNLDEGEKFLRDYILNQKYLEKDGSEKTDNVFSDSEEETLEKQEEFERKFNFRFEEPDQDFIKRYPRTVEKSMRKKDDKRKKRREEVKTRKQAERAQKDEELKRLKKLKRAEIIDKIKKLQEVTGNEEMTFQDGDVEGDFDPNEHDKRMAELFNQDFYETNVDEDKPEFPELDQELEIEKWDEWGGRNENSGEQDLHCEDPGFVMDCDYDPKAASQQEIVESTRRKKKKRQSKFAEAASRAKPLFDPKDKNFEKYFDEYYGLNYEDLIGDIPCRFKYRKVVPNDFGLSIEEILSAPDKELNRWVSVKKIMQRRPEHVELYDVKAYQKKAKNITKKMQCLPSIYDTSAETEDNDLNPSFGQEGEVKSNAKILESKSKKEKKEKRANNAIENVIDATQNKKTQLKQKIKQEEKESGEEAALRSPKKKISKKKKQSMTQVSNETALGLDKSNSTCNVLFNNKKRKRFKSQEGNKEMDSTEAVWKKSKRGNNISHYAQADPLTCLSDARLKSYGLNPKKFKNKLKYARK